MAESRTIHILMLEDVTEDAELICRTLRDAGLIIVVSLVADETRYREALTTSPPDIILSDFSLPAFDGLSALILRAMLAPAVPFIFVTGVLGEERAVEMLHIGASDYVLKGNLKRLPIAILRALAEADDGRIRQSMAQQLNNERQLLSAVLDTSGALIVLIDANGKIVRLNPSAAQVLALPAERAVGLAFDILFATASEQPAVRAQIESLHTLPPEGRTGWQSSVGLRKVLWSMGRLSDRSAGGGFAVASGIDITAQQDAEQQAYFLRYFDIATGLPNRDMLLQRMHNAGGGRAALVIVGLSRLQDVRDSLGIDKANQLLAEAARRLSPWVRTGDCLARIGDDNFALLITAPPDGLDTVLRDILTRIHLPYPLESNTVFLGAHLGVAYQGRQDHPEEVLRAAMAALHLAMRQQGEHYHFYQPLLSDEARMRLELEAELHAALAADDQLVLEYQPQVDIASGRIVGVEALMRWQHPRHGRLAPMHFIPLAESRGLIDELGERALQIACRQARAWQDQGLAPITVAVNLSALQWSQPGLVDTIRATLDACNLDPRWLELELTESASMQNPVTTLSTMETLREMGIQLSIDDFGTGFCSLSYLKRFPVDKLKIDQSFVRDIISQPDDLIISRLIVAMGHLLRLSVVAEGVETEGQMILLAEAGCDCMQGYLYSRPVDAAACARLMARPAAPISPGRRLHPRHVLWLDHDDVQAKTAQDWLQGIDCRLLPARSIGEAFELLATHNVAAAVLAGDGAGAIDEYARSLHAMHPQLPLFGIGDGFGMNTITAIPAPPMRSALLTALDALFAASGSRGQAAP